MLQSYLILCVACQNNIHVDIFHLNVSLFFMAGLIKYTESGRFDV